MKQKNKQREKRKKEFGKKAQVFPALFVLVTLIIFTTLYLDFAAKTKKFDDKKLGERQFAVLRTAAEGEKALLYVDIAAEYAYDAAVLETAKQNYVDAAFCGQYRGVPLVYGTTDCMRYGDDLEKALEKAVTAHFNAAFALYAEAYSETSEIITIPEKNYLLTFDDDDGKVIGTALAPLEFLIMSTTSAEIIEHIDTEEKEETVAAITRKSYPKINAKNAQELVLKIDENYGDIIERAVAGTDVPKALVIAVIAQESGGNPTAVSPTGCAGLMQFCPSTAKSYGLSLDDRLVPEKAIPAGVALLQDNIKSFSGSHDKVAFALAAYNGGVGIVKKAMQKTGKTEPAWEEVKVEITEELIAEIYSKSFKASIYSKYFGTLEKRNAKVREIQNYVGSVLLYYYAYEQATEKE